jgi:hypothetical protein
MKAIDYFFKNYKEATAKEADKITDASVMRYC